MQDECAAGANLKHCQAELELLPEWEVDLSDKEDSTDIDYEQETSSAGCSNEPKCSEDTDDKNNRPVSSK